MRIHGLLLDLQSARFELRALVTDDPDGTGPAEGVLEKPMSLAERSQVVAAINANAFDVLPDPAGKKDRKWNLGRSIEILGWAKNDDREHSPPHSAYSSFWIDPHRRGHFRRIDKPVEATHAVAGFGMLLIDGAIATDKDKNIHPRTALGLDKEGRWLWMIVVDGRQKGTSEGVTLYELATLMKDLGCWQALNLDGGGSSVMIANLDGKALTILNRPSDWGTRPVPVMLGVRNVAE